MVDGRDQVVFEGPVWALGAMSGTSLDGVDAALLLTDGDAIFAFGASGYRRYSVPERAVLRAALGKWEGGEDAARMVGAAHVAAMAPLAGDAALAGFHGQTVAHDPGAPGGPRGRGTRQLGDGAALSNALGLPVVWDFRSADVAAGGQGAPLASFYHHACARWMKAEAPVAFLNLGGVGNLTLVDPRQPDPAARGACVAFDTGPANAPLDDFVALRTGAAQDEGGRLASRGRADDGIVARLLADPYFARPAPKSLDRDDWSWLAEAVAGLSDADGAATLTACAAQAVLAGLRLCGTPPARLLVSGGGRRNPVLMAAISRGAPCPVEPVEAAGLDGDMLEAQAFAYLAVRLAREWPISAPGTTGVATPVAGGRVSLPSAPGAGVSPRSARSMTGSAVPVGGAAGERAGLRVSASTAMPLA